VKHGFHAAAEAELNQAVDYYNACRPNLGWEFAAEIQATIQNIMAYPEAWTPLSKRARRCLCAVSRMAWCMRDAAISYELWLSCT
jgi:toxin ParE1/3/4